MLCNLRDSSATFVGTILDCRTTFTCSSNKVLQVDICGVLMTQRLGQAERCIYSAYLCLGHTGNTCLRKVLEASYPLPRIPLWRRERKRSRARNDLCLKRRLCKLQGWLNLDCSSKFTISLKQRGAVSLATFELIVWSLHF